MKPDQEPVEEALDPKSFENLSLEPSTATEQPGIDIFSSHQVNFDTRLADPGPHYDSIFNFS